MFIDNDKIYVSYTEELREDCWNTSIIYGDLNYTEIQFEKFFSPTKCVHETDNEDNEFVAHQSGGRIIKFDNNHILFSIGDYRSRHLSQEKDSVNGKVLKININNSSYEIISMGHRNAQGLFFDKEKNIILETEHGPRGGDEVNIIEVDKINKDDILNYGWAIASEGEHYQNIPELYEKYPLYKSHPDHGFIPSLDYSTTLR